HASPLPPQLHPFPTRRSSDLPLRFCSREVMSDEPAGQKHPPNGSPSAHLASPRNTFGRGIHFYNVLVAEPKRPFRPGCDGRELLCSHFHEATRSESREESPEGI